MTHAKEYFQRMIDCALPVGGMVRRFKYSLVFKTTNYCCYNCAHCCENSGPDQKKEFIPVNIIQDYITQAKCDKRFSDNVIFTGGEIFSSYQFGDTQYIPTLLKTCIDKKIGVDIKTNAAWVRTALAPEIFRDLIKIAKDSPDPYAYQISLSLDKYHPNAVDNAVRVITELARKKCRVIINIASFGADAHMFDALKRKIGTKMPVEDAAIPITKSQKRYVTVVNNRVIIQTSLDGVPFANGRAVNLPDAKPTDFPQFRIMCETGSILIAFDTFGRVTLGENSGRKIGCAWNRPDGAAKLNTITKDLLFMAQCEEIRAIIKEGWRPPKIRF